MNGISQRSDSEMEEQKRCVTCRSEIPDKATVCRYCQREQSQIYLTVNRMGGVIAILGLIGTLIGTYLAITAASSAKKDGELAQISFENSKIIEKRVGNLVDDLKITKSNLYAAVGDVYGEMSVNIQQTLPIYRRLCDAAAGRQTGSDCAAQMGSLLETMSRAYNRHDAIDSGVAKLAGIDKSAFKEWICLVVSSMSPDEYRRFTNLPAQFEASIDDYFQSFEEKCDG